MSSTYEKTILWLMNWLTSDYPCFSISPYNKLISSFISVHLGPLSRGCVLWTQTTQYGPRTALCLDTFPLHCDQTRFHHTSAMHTIWPFILLLWFPLHVFWVDNWGVVCKWRAISSSFEVVWWVVLNFDHTWKGAMVLNLGCSDLSRFTVEKRELIPNQLKIEKKTVST